MLRAYAWFVLVLNLVLISYFVLDWLSFHVNSERLHRFIDRFDRFERVFDLGLFVWVWTSGTLALWVVLAK
jgi:hypothetical protein